MVWCSDYHFRENVNSEEVSDNVFFFICVYALKNKKRRVTVFNSNTCLVYIYPQLGGTVQQLQSLCELDNHILGATSPLCYMQLGRGGGGTSKNNSFVSYFL